MTNQTLQDVLRLPADLPRLNAEVNQNHSLPVIENPREDWEAMNLATPLAEE